jgi:hypothetical protein
MKAVVQTAADEPAAIELLQRVENCLSDLDERWPYCAFPSLSSTGSPNFPETRWTSASTLERNSFRIGEVFALL